MTQWPDIERIRYPLNERIGKMYLYHTSYGVLAHAGRGDYWKRNDGELFSTFLDVNGTIVSLPLREVKVITNA